MIHLPEPKKAAALIRHAFADKGVKVPTKEAYNLLAQLWGYNDWATYCGLNPKAGAPAAVNLSKAVPFGREEAELQGWPTWVVLNRSGDDGEEELFILPYGATLEDRLNARNSWALFNDDDAIPLTVGFTDPAEPRESWQDLVVATVVGSEFPRADEYGFPMFANDREVAKWLEETMGWGHLTAGKYCQVEVITNDRGDDGGENWWVELRVHPAVHARLLTQFEARNIAFEHVWPRIVLDTPYAPRAGETGFDPRIVALRQSVGRVFADLNNLNLGDVMNAFNWHGDELATGAEEFLRKHLNDELVTVQGEYSPMDAASLQDRLQSFIDAAAKVPV